MDWLRTQRPELVRRYGDLYRRGAYTPADERQRLARLVHRPGVKSRFRQLSKSPTESLDEPIQTDATQQSLF